MEIRECEGVYPPREDSHLLLRSMELRAGESLLDMGTGTGIIGIHAALLGATVTVADISEKALACAEKNAEINGVRIKAVKSDIFSAIDSRYDVISFNPPYLPPSGEDYGDIKHSLEAENGGSAVAERFIEGLGSVLKGGGRAYLLLSSLTDLKFLGSWREKFTFQEVARQHLFFEEIFVFMLKERKDL